MNSHAGRNPRRWMLAVLLGATSLLSSPVTRADVSISSKPTQSMSCSAGVCIPTAHNAVLNVGDLTNMLAGGDVTVETGSGAANIVVKAAFSWASANRLTLDAIQSVEVDKPITVAGPGAMTITTNDGGSGGDLVFTGKGNIGFWDLTSNLVIDGNSYVLAKKLKDVAKAIRRNNAAFVALAGDYNAKRDGTYTASPIVQLSGTLEGLGHVIANLSIDSTIKKQPIVGLISRNAGTVRDVGLSNADIEAHGSNRNIVGGLVAINNGTIIGAFVDGQIVGGGAKPFTGVNYAGGLVGENAGVIVRSHADANVTATPAGNESYLVGGLVGYNYPSEGQIHLSYATGDVSIPGDGPGVGLGGLVGGNGGYIEESFATGNVIGLASQSGGLIGGSGHEENCYAMGSVSGADWVGGFAGVGDGFGMQTSYSTGAVNGISLIGGFVAMDENQTASNSYWDLETSGVSDPSQGAGSPSNDSGITGLTTAQLQSGLPDGFDPAVWAEDPKINGGFPYLRAVPPQ